jgi:hypothetical protein
MSLLSADILVDACGKLYHRRKQLGHQKNKKVHELTEHI